MSSGEVLSLEPNLALTEIWGGTNDMGAATRWAALLYKLFCHIKVSDPRLPSLWSGTSGTGSLRAAGTTWGASPRSRATRRVLITSFTGSGHERGILSYYCHLGNYSQPSHPEKSSLENKSSPSPGTQHGPASHGRDKG